MTIDLIPYIVGSMSWINQLEKFSDRRKEIYEKNKAGKSYSKLAIEYGITASRVGAIVSKERLKEQAHEAQIAQE